MSTPGKSPQTEFGYQLVEFVKDYKAATALHVPNYSGGINSKVAAELIRMGWRKPINSN